MYEYSWVIRDLTNPPDFGSKSDGAISFDANVQKFRVYWIQDLIPADFNFADYEITLIANQVDSDVVLTTPFNLRIKSPCVDMNWRIVSELTMPPQVFYKLGDSIQIED